MMMDIRRMEFLYRLVQLESCRSNIGKLSCLLICLCFLGGACLRECCPPACLASLIGMISLLFLFRLRWTAKSSSFMGFLEVFILLTWSRSGFYGIFNVALGWLGHGFLAFVVYY
jgi:hypothetical protein